MPESFPPPFTGQTSSDHYKILTTNTSHCPLHAGIFIFIWKALNFCRQALESSAVHFRRWIPCSNDLQPAPLLPASSSRCQEFVDTILASGYYRFEFIGIFNGKFLFLTLSINLTIRFDICIYIWLFHNIVNLLVYSDRVKNISGEKVRRPHSPAMMNSDELQKFYSYFY